MIRYEVWVENDTLELAALVKANSIEEAREWATARYGKNCRVEVEPEY